MFVIGLWDRDGDLVLNFNINYSLLQEAKDFKATILNKTQLSED